MPLVSTSTILLSDLTHLIVQLPYEEGIKFLESYKIEGTENDLLLGLLRAVSAQYGYDYCCGSEELEKFFALHSEELQKLLDKREGAWVHPEEGKLEKAIQELEGEMKKEIPNEIAVREFINNLRGYICTRNMTTAALKEILGTLLSHRRDRFLSFGVTNGIITASSSSTGNFPLFTQNHPPPPF